MGARFLKIAVCYLVLGVSLGLVMGLRHEFTLAPVHAHINLLGWASLAIVGLIYHVYPGAGTTRLARAHFWLHNVALPVLMIGLGATLLGHAEFGAAVGIGSIALVAALVIFALNVLTSVRVPQ